MTIAAALAYLSCRAVREKGDAPTPPTRLFLISVVRYLKVNHDWIIKVNKNYRTYFQNSSTYSLQM